MSPKYFTHVYNRGVDKRPVFLSDRHRERFLLTLRLSRLSHAPPPSTLNVMLAHGDIQPNILINAEKAFGPPIIDLIGFCEMGNHFHLITGEESADRKALSKFMQRVGTAYTMYFNKIVKRTGRLFESKYHSADIESHGQLISVMRYVHVNPATKSARRWNVNSLPQYPWSSLPVYLEQEAWPWINTAPVMESFSDRNEFWKYTTEAIHQPLSSILKKGLRLE